ncbi:hypothetical protein [Macrococcus capreoli]|nr:hypothetical protein [Macrococcus sp. TMW 2.2395]MCU7558197.1 hypothetical protein [Macrococcus sp. TMW 2.2395]
MEKIVQNSKFVEALDILMKRDITLKQKINKLIEITFKKNKMNHL